MNDGMLSQDEIDALLNSTDDDQPDTTDNNDEQAERDIENLLSDLEIDALGEIGNISFGSSATTLSTLLNQKVDITTPTISIISRNRLEEEFPNPNVGVEVKYTEGFEGANLFVLDSNDAAIIADLMLGGDGKTDSQELNEISLSAVQEAMNQMMGTAATSMSTIFSKRVDISPPAIMMLDVNDDNKADYMPEDDIFVKVSFQLKIGELIDSNIMQLLPLSFAKEMVEGLLNGPTDKEEQAPVTTQTETNHVQQEEAPVQKPNRQSPSNQPAEPKNLGELSQENASIQNASFSAFDNVDLPQSEKRNLGMLMDIPLQVTVELGRTKRSVKDILELSSGSIIELDKLAGEPVDIHVNNKLIAQGEVVVIDENFGVRVTDIVSQSDRLRKLK